VAYPLAPTGSTLGTSAYPFTVAANTLQATGFIPEIWSGKLVEKFYASTVLAAISNTDYEGEIKNQGDKVRIRTKPTITIRDYAADQSLMVERPSGNILDLLIDKGKYFNTILDDVMDIQSDLNLLSMWSDDAAEQMKITIDTAVLGGMQNQATAVTNRGATAGKISANINLGVTSTGPLAVVSRSPAAGKVEILDAILRLGQVLDEQNIPETGRWVVLPTWAATLIKMSELREAYLSGDGTSILRNGRIGMVDRFTLYTSNLLPSGTAATPPLVAGEYLMYAGHAHGLTFASQMTKMETLRSEQTFGTLMRGLQVFGWKVVDGSALAQAVIVPG
jgi:hypothetical protein